MKRKRSIKSLEFKKKTISHLSLQGGVYIISELPHTYKQGCVTDPRICDPASFPIDCFPLDTLNCPVL